MRILFHYVSSYVKRRKPFPVLSFVGILTEELLLRHIIYHMLDDRLLQIDIIAKLADESELLEIFP